MSGFHNVVCFLLPHNQPKPRKKITQTVSIFPYVVASRQLIGYTIAQHFSECSLLMNISAEEFQNPQNET
jgi:hypothetical protein